MDNLSLKKTQVDVKLLRYILVLLNMPKEELIEISNYSENTDQSRFTSSRRNNDTGYGECNQQLPKYRTETSRNKNSAK